MISHDPVQQLNLSPFFLGERVRYREVIVQPQSLFGISCILLSASAVCGRMVFGYEALAGAGLVRLYLLSNKRLSEVRGRHSFLLLLSTEIIDARLIYSIVLVTMEQIVDSTRESVQVSIDTIHQIFLACYLDIVELAADYR